MFYDKSKNIRNNSFLPQSMYPEPHMADAKLLKVILTTSDFSKNLSDFELIFHISTPI